MWRVFRDSRALGVSILVFACLLDSSTSIPVEEPTRFTLATGGNTNAKNVATNTVFGFDQGQELLGRFADAIRIGTGRLVNSVTLARNNIIADRPEIAASESRTDEATVKSAAPSQGQSFPSTTTQYPPVTNTGPYARETVRLENESAQGFFEKPVSKPISGFLESFLSPTPIVDGIQERDKYGNNGDKFIGIGRAFVNGFEGLSNFLNAIVDFPKNAVKKTSRGITEALNHVGARLVGLE